MKSEEFLNDYITSIVTLGMTPDRPETGYGYIEVGEKEHDSDKLVFYRVNRFVEKPNKEKAIKYLENGNFLWNGGIFIWKVEGILSKIKEYMPSTYEALENVTKIEEEKLEKYVYENYKNTEATSIDYGILEKCNEIYVIPSDIEWDDVGNWDAMDRYREKDEHGNIVIGDSKRINSKNNIIISNGKKIIVEDLEDIYILEGEETIIVGKRSNINKIKNIKESVGL